ncbi:metal-dependent phosphohydrolase HD sub domain [Clostridium bornimense]|uniref:Metal-dependent phosphohydrolase HD sub domain n=1 Tax=Clostridium bornimense TaxID=1216932 RepID=W6RY84_9CLOT|nr:HD domain-containing protein [Clostridium bornimense]CDM69626.1 metal-dependent phosphohydrolase HD sub domain [Clostridium bornimense]
MIEEIILKMIEYFDGDIKRINHAIKVYQFAKLISSRENMKEDEYKGLEIAAILHDIGIKNAERKYNSSAGNYQEIEGPEVAEELLNEFNIDKDTIERIKFLIGNHHSYNNIDKIDFQILIESDFLVNIDEDNIEIEAIKIIKDKYFKTNIGIKLIESMYINKKIK